MIQHKILSERNYAYIEIRQSPPLAEFISAARLFINDLDYGPDLHRICDFSQANLSHITHDDLLRFVQFARSHIALGRQTRCALVAPASDRSGLFEAFSENMESGNFRIFMDPEAAVAWVGEADAGEELGLPHSIPAPPVFDKILAGVA